MMITIFTNYQLALFVAQLNVAFEIHFQFGLESLSYFFCYCFFFHFGMFCIQNIIYYGLFVHFQTK